MEDATRVETLELTPIDQTICRIYVRLLLFFPFKPEEGPLDDINRQISWIRDRYRATIECWPFLAGNIGPHKDPGEAAAGKLQLEYKWPVPDDEIDQRIGLAMFPEKSPWTYEELSAAGAPPSWCSKKLFTMSPNHPKEGNAYPATTLAITFMEGGLVLGFAFHHAVMDGPSVKQFLTAFATGCRKENIKSICLVLVKGRKNR